nr:winged helix-turn-helix transcriptional regulator [Gordonia sp. LAM0048]
MALFDLLGRRDCLAVLWALREGPLTFRELQGAAGGVAAATLNSRTRDLREARLLELGESGYALTVVGRELLEVGLPLEGWAEGWAPLAR